jgi:Putative sterol carrier protein
LSAFTRIYVTIWLILFVSQTSKLLFPSKEWAQAFTQELEHDQDFKKVASGWAWRVVVRITELPDELAKSFGSKSIGLMLDLLNSKCVECKLVSEKEAAKIPYKLTASYNVWLKVLKQELEPYQALVTGKINLRGDLPRITRFSDAALMIVRAMAKVGCSN